MLSPVRGCVSVASRRFSALVGHRGQISKRTNPRSLRTPDVNNFQITSLNSLRLFSVDTSINNVERASLECLKQWGNFVEKKNIEGVLGQYHSDGKLWPTLSHSLRGGSKEMRSYFHDFLPKINGPVRWDQCVFQSISNTHCVWSGTYTFSLTSGQTPARFTYVLNKREDGEWRVMNHHSSLMPESGQ